MVASLAGFILRDPCEELPADAQCRIRGECIWMFDEGQELQHPDAASLLMICTVSAMWAQHIFLHLFKTQCRDSTVFPFEIVESRRSAATIFCISISASAASN
jgi:hypothetical protein